MGGRVDAGLTKNARERARHPSLIKPPFGRVMVAKPSHLGDLVISLPMAASLKRRDPGCTVVFLANSVTAEVARCCPAVDEVVSMPDDAAALPALLASLNLQAFINVNSWSMLAAAAKKAAVPVRIGSLYRLSNWLYCTHLVAIARASCIAAISPAEVASHLGAWFAQTRADRVPAMAQGQPS